MADEPRKSKKSKSADGDPKKPKKKKQAAKEEVLSVEDIEDEEANIPPKRSSTRKSKAAEHPPPPPPPPPPEEPDEPSALAEMLKQLSECALRRDDVVKLRAAELAPSAATDAKAKDGNDEPEVDSRAARKVWVRWAKAVAKEHANTVHPRKKHPDGSMSPLRFTAPPNDIVDAMGGIVPNLYLDFLKFCAGYCMIGALLSAPSYWLSYLHAHEVFSELELWTYPTTTLHLSIAARSQCFEAACEAVNLAAGLTEAAFSLLLLLGVRRFRRRVRALNAANEANNVFTSEYAVQLHGLPRDATASEVKEHVEAAVAAASGLAPELCAVWDVALMTDCSAVLRNAVKQAPLERRFAVAERKLQLNEAFQKEKATGWAQMQKINELKGKIDAIAKRLMSVRQRMERRIGHGEKFARRSCTAVVGAFVTFEEQPARDAALALYPGGLPYWLQPKARRFRGTRRLRAYEPSQPRDVQHENLPYRLLACNCRALGTLLRRLASFSLLCAFIMFSFGVIIAVNAPKTDPAALLALTNQYNLSPSTAELLVDTIFPLAASVVVVVVNKAIEVLVGALGAFERHPSISAMHSSKAVTIFLGQTFNTGFVSLLLLAAPPPKLYATMEAGCQCANGVFCCLIGPKGVLMRGVHLTMSAAWHNDVGTLLVSAMIVQAVAALAGPGAPYLVAKLKRCLLANSAAHRVDMEKLWTGPEKDVPKFLGKAYAYAFLVFAYSGVLPALYLAGIVFFGGLWFCERFAFLYVHSTPPPYSYKLIEGTLWWMPWAVFLHVGFTFWGMSELPSLRVREGHWARPYDNQTLAQAMATPRPPASHTLPGAFAFNSAMEGASAEHRALAEYMAAADTLYVLYDVPAHVNSLATLVLFLGALFLLVWLLVGVLRASPLYWPLRPLELAVKRCLASCACDATQPKPRLFQRGAQKGAKRRRKKKAPKGKRVAPGEEDEEETEEEDDEEVAAAEEGRAGDESAPPPPPAGGANPKVVDPPFSKMLEGVTRESVRLLGGRVLHAFQLLEHDTCYETAGRWTPTSLVFRLLGMAERLDAPVSQAQWEKATPVFSKLVGASDISYQPEFHPKYETAFTFLAKPGKLKAFAAAKNVVVGLEAMKARLAEKKKAAEDGWKNRHRLADD